MDTKNICFLKIKYLINICNVFVLRVYCEHSTTLTVVFLHILDAFQMVVGDD